MPDDGQTPQTVVFVEPLFPKGPSTPKIGFEVCCRSLKPEPCKASVFWFGSPCTLGEGEGVESLTCLGGGLQMRGWASLKYFGRAMIEMVA